MIEMTTTDFFQIVLNHCLRSEIDNLQLKYPNPMTSEDVINNDSPSDHPEIPIILVFLHKFQNVSMIVLKELIML